MRTIPARCERRRRRPPPSSFLDHPRCQSSLRIINFPLALIMTSCSNVVGRIAPVPLFVQLQAPLVKQRSQGRRPWLGVTPLSKQSITSPTFETTRQQLSSSDNDEMDATTSNINGMYLDEETYLQAEDTLLRSDGSLDLETDEPLERRRGRRRYEVTPNPPVPKIKNKTYQAAMEGLFSPAPSYTYSDDTTNNDSDNGLSQSQKELSDEEKLYQTVMEIESGKQSNSQSMMDPEALHTQVFAEEQTYLEQSEEFRNSLSHLLDKDAESPMARERREVIQQYNEQVLEGLMKEMDEMEEMAVSREEALERAKEQQQAAAAGGEQQQRQGKKDAMDVICSRCGLRVTPDVLERAEKFEIAQGGGLKRKSGEDAGILCNACYGQQFRAVDEAKVRIGDSSQYGGYSSSSRMFDKNKSAQQQWRRKGDGSYRGRRRSTDWDGSEDGRRSKVQGIDTSSLFDLPKGYVTDRGKSSSEPRATKPNSTNSNRSYPNNNTPSEGPSEGRQRSPPRRTSRMLGGGQLAKRMEQDTNSDNFDQRTASRPEITQRAVRQTVRRNRPSEVDDPVFVSTSDDENVGSTPVDIVKEESTNNIDSSGGNNWVKVEDPGTKRILYWNKETGEMKKSLE